MNWEKKWHLYSYLELLDYSLALERKKALKDKFLLLENPGSPLDLATNFSGKKPLGRIPKVTDDNFLDTIKWVSWRTEASLSMPCCLCGTFNNVEMHHLNHVRKNKYSSIPTEHTWEQIMHLRNRKQIPVCTACHRTVIHKGTYNGPRLINMALRRKETSRQQNNTYRMFRLKRQTLRNKNYPRKRLEKNKLIFLQ